MARCDRATLVFVRQKLLGCSYAEEERDICIFLKSSREKGAISRISRFSQLNFLSQKKTVSIRLKLVLDTNLCDLLPSSIKVHYFSFFLSSYKIGARIFNHVFRVFDIDCY